MHEPHLLKKGIRAAYNVPLQRCRLGEIVVGIGKAGVCDPSDGPADEAIHRFGLAPLFRRVLASVEDLIGASSVHAAAQTQRNLLEEVDAQLRLATEASLISLRAHQVHDGGTNASPIQKGCALLVWTWRGRAIMRLVQSP